MWCLKLCTVMISIWFDVFIPVFMTLALFSAITGESEVTLEYCILLF